MRRFFFLIFFSLCFVCMPAQAADEPVLSTVAQDLQIKSPVNEISIPGFDPNKNINFSTDTDGKVYIYLPWIGDYIAAWYKFGLAAISIIAVAMMIRQGFQIVLGGEGKVNAYKRIGQIVIAVCLAWGSYAILYFINPALTQFNALKVEYIKGIPLQEHLGGGNEDNPIIGGVGILSAADANSCPKMEVGTTFSNAAFTTYYNLNPKNWGEAGNYAGIYKGSNPNLQGKGDFFCAVSMECGCSGVGYVPEKQCANSKKSWSPCKYFDKTAKYCDANPKNYIAGQTVAASTCFPKGTKLKVGSHILTVTDRGAGIIGTHFDLYLGVKGEPGFVSDVSWLQTDDIQIIAVGNPISNNELARMRAAYERYKPGVCKPGTNC